MIMLDQKFPQGWKAVSSYIKFSKGFTPTELIYQQNIFHEWEDLKLLIQKVRGTSGLSITD